jgi:hypothetical protein
MPLQKVEEAVAPAGGGAVKLYVSEEVMRTAGSWTADPKALPGDWDLSLEVGACVRRKDLIVAPDLAADVMPVLVTRAGKLVLATPRQRGAAESGGPIKICIVGRHPDWILFRQTLRRFIDTGEYIVGCSYSPLTHPDFAGIPSWVGRSRYDAIARHMAPGASVIDLGAHFGYMCECLEDDGHRCLAVERDPECYYFLSRLKQAQDYTYESICGEASDVVRTRAEGWHTVLALALFHHFVKTREGHDALEELLSNLRAEQMFFWAPNPAEKQMSGAYRNYEPAQFADFVRVGARLRHAEPIGIFRDRVLFHIWR